MIIEVHFSFVIRVTFDRQVISLNLHRIMSCKALHDVQVCAYYRTGFLLQQAALFSLSKKNHYELSRSRVDVKEATVKCLFTALSGGSRHVQKCIRESS